MRILIDIEHPAHLNFFKKTISILQDQGHKIYITAIRRGRLPQMVKDELPNSSITFNGKHTGSKWSIIFEANILRFFQQLNYVIGKKIDVAVSVGSFTTGAIFKFILFKPNIQFDDDPERKMNVILERITSTELFFPPILTSKLNNKNNVRIFNALKEWAYLSPKYFSPDKDVLSEYGLLPSEYFFIREISTGSLNYIDQTNNIIASFANRLPKNFKVVISLEDKSKIRLYPKNWILLKEPVSKIHSLIYYSKLVISSGDSMAREGAMLGVPSIYCGIRNMAANKVMKKKGLLFHKNIEFIPRFVEQIINNELNLQEQEKYRKELENEWDDVTEFIIDTIIKYK